VISVVGQALAGLLPLIQKVVLDDVIISHRRALLPWLGLFVAVGAVSFVLHYARRQGAARVSLDLQHDLRRAIHRKVNALDMTHHDRLSTGDVMSRAVGDVTLIQMFVNQIPMLAANLALLLVGVGVMLMLSPLLCAVFLLFVPVFFGLAVRFRDQVFPASWNDQRLAAAVAGAVDEAVSGVRVVKAFAQERRETALLLAKAKDLFRSRLRTARLTALYSATLQAVPALAQLGILLLGGWLALRAQITVGVFLAFSSYLLQLVAPLRLLSGMLATSQQARAGAERVLELLELEPAVFDRPGARALDDCSGAVELDDVTFAHEGKPVLQGLTLRIAPGERVGIVGASGSGKTTLAMLIARFYEPTTGSVRIDGRDVRDYTVDSVRKSVGLVFDESFLFSTTIRDNIALGRSGASDEEIEAAARAAEAHGFIAALRDGYRTRVGERGYTLSGGQRQRIALARAALAKPDILVLDDATSAVDARTEESIHGSLEKLLGRRTTILIAHRLSTLRLATRVVVLDGGRVVAEGTNEQLFRTCPLYRELLTGPSESDETCAEPVESVDADRIDPRAWPERDLSRPSAQVTSLDAELAIASAKATGVGGGGGGQRELGGGRAAFVPATPELLARVAKLPPADDEPYANVDFDASDDTSPSFRALVRPFRWALGLGFALVAIDALTTLAGPYITGRAIDGGILRRSWTALAVLSAWFFVVQLVGWSNSRLMQVQTAKTAENMLLSLRMRTFAHLQRLSLDFFEREMSGRIMTRMTTDVEAFAQLLQQGLLTRRQLGYVLQEPFLFSGTIRSNIAYGRPDASDLEVENAAHAVGAHELIAKLPHGYLTPVTERGRSLSIGERQLVCLARAELVDPRILILDEATSNLDLATEARVQRAMRALSRGRTTFVIAHRLQTARIADKIVVVEYGRIAEAGSHAALLRRGGRYAQLWRAFAEAGSFQRLASTSSSRMRGPDLARGRGNAVRVDAARINNRIVHLKAWLESRNGRG
jgi:ATP-binding cassette subfamily B protein